MPNGHLDLPRIKAVVFDMDDTLLNWRQAEQAAIARLASLHFAVHGVAPDRVREVYNAVMAENFAAWKTKREWMYIDVRLRILNERLATHDRLKVEDLVATFSREATTKLEFLEGAEAALRGVRASGRKSAILTNGRSEVQRPKIYAFGLHTEVDFVGITGELGVWKPDAMAFRLVLDSLGVQPTDALMVGDNEDFDITPAKALGMQTCWVDPEGRTHADADLVVRTPGELASLFQSTGSRPTD
ncbi:MAG: HAD family hydrolase [Candidatus Thermoplasmatota archaeon]